MTFLDHSEQLISMAFAEDVPSGDITTEVLYSNHNSIPKNGRIKVFAREDLVLSGSQLFQRALHFKDPSLKLEWSFKDGQVVLANQIVVVIQGDQIPVLAAERVALNFLGRLSGIATKTKAFVNALEGSKIKILDTRKTTPAFRFLEKQAVIHGGGTNHRMNLSDAVLIKDNHIKLVGGVTTALEHATKYHQGSIEIEVDTIDQLKECLPYKVDRVLLDNMDDQTILEALKIIPSNWEVEVSGGITLERLTQLKKMDIDFISVGGLTHSAACVDFSMEFDWS